MRISARFVFAVTLAVGVTVLLAASKWQTCNCDFIQQFSHSENCRYQPPHQTVTAAKLQLPAVCNNTHCAHQFLENHAQHQHHRVPAIRHILWKNTKVPKYFLKQLQTWRTIHPNWTYVLWQDSDLHPFVQKYFPGKVWQKYKSLPIKGWDGIKRIDMFRYLLLYKFGGVYADLDYSLVSSLDKYRHFPAVVTREPEIHSIMIFQLSRWPLPILANPAFMMSAPGHSFMQFCVQQIINTPASRSIMEFAGPAALSNMLQQFSDIRTAMLNADEFVYIPPSYSFYPYDKNRFSSNKQVFASALKYYVQSECKKTNVTQPEVAKFCADTDNLDPLIDSRHPVVAVHDIKKSAAVYNNPGAAEYVGDKIDLLQEMPNVMLGSALL